jgi:membrane-associated phospholipid phosphatase
MEEIPHSQKYSRFFGLHFLALFLNVSLFVPPTNALWQWVDTQCFLLLNSYVAQHPLQQIFWALGNVKVTDLFGASFLVLFFLLYVLEAAGKERQKRYAQLIYALVWFEITMFSCKQIATPYLSNLGWGRHSPSVMLNHSLQLSDVAPWLKIKDSSFFCFPADHAFVAFLWCSFIWFFAGRRSGIMAFSLSWIFLLPRLIAGAHWLSDALVGSTSVVAIAMAWATCTPLFPKGMNFLYRFTGYQQGEAHV